MLLPWYYHSSFWVTFPACQPFLHGYTCALQTPRGWANLTVHLSKQCVLPTAQQTFLSHLGHVMVIMHRFLPQSTFLYSPCFSTIRSGFPCNLLNLNFYSIPHRYDFLELNIQNKLSLIHFFKVLLVIF
jgi:hypothetical protein